MSDGFRIGEVAERAGVSIDTVRFYERRKLLPRAPRTSGGYRTFSDETVERLIFIKQSQELGFTLEEIGVLLANNGVHECRKVRDLLSVKLIEIDKRLKRLKDFRGTLTKYLAECEDQLSNHPDSADCPVVVEIAGVEINETRSTHKVGRTEQRGRILNKLKV